MSGPNYTPDPDGNHVPIHRCTDSVCAKFKKQALFLNRLFCFVNTKNILLRSACRPAFSGSNAAMDFSDKPGTFLIYGLAAGFGF